jgi:S-adenosylmethionine hydrolase
MAVITLTTDFGLRDGFVGSIKGTILGLVPEIQIVDISHDIEPHNINGAAFILQMCRKFFPAGTIHIVVVDPGVGSQRRILCVSAARQFFLAPDNGVLKYVFHECPDARVVSVTERKYFLKEVSQTFHGRDIFAPSAAHLASGVKMAALGPPVDDYERGKIPQVRVGEKSIEGEVIYVDRFGNLITNLTLSLLESSRRISSIRIKDRVVKGLSDSYASVGKMELVALIGSSGGIEIAASQASAKALLCCSEGESVIAYYV